MPQFSLVFPAFFNFLCFWAVPVFKKSLFPSAFPASSSTKRRPCFSAFPLCSPICFSVRRSVCLLEALPSFPGAVVPSCLPSVAAPIPPGNPPALCSAASCAPLPVLLQQLKAPPASPAFLPRLRSSPRPALRLPAPAFRWRCFRSVPPRRTYSIFLLVFSLFHLHFSAFHDIILSLLATCFPHVLDRWFRFFQWSFFIARSFLSAVMR